MSDLTAPAAAAAAPVVQAPGQAAPATESKPLALAPAEVEPSEAYEIDGRTVMLTRTQARTHIQKSGAVDKRMQEAAEKQKSLDALLKLYDTDPEAALRQSGRDPDKLLAAFLARKAKLELMSPEQQEAAKIQEERDELKTRLEKLEAERKAEAQASVDQRNQDALEVQLISSAEKYGLDKTPETLEGLCQVAGDLLDYGTIPTPDQVAQEYIRREQEHLESRERKYVAKLKGEPLKKYLQSNMPALLALPAAELLEVLGPAGVKAIQAATLSRIPAAAKKPVLPAAPAPAPVPRRNDAGKFVSEADFDKRFSRR